MDQRFASQLGHAERDRDCCRSANSDQQKVILLTCIDQLRSRSSAGIAPSECTTFQTDIVTVRRARMVSFRRAPTHNGQSRDYVPDSIVRLKTEPPTHLILETKGFDDLADVKSAAAQRCVAALNADGRMGCGATKLREE
jgi:hypothetical protein